ncbi:MAG: hypothetical protein JNM36_16630 [Chitinophagales bacterium]|nr:hypothetical protein [Chitinophagales bacterium]
MNLLPQSYRFVKILSTIYVLLTITPIFGQTTACDTIHNSPHKMPMYDNDMIGLLQYLSNELMPFIAECRQQDSIMISYLVIVLTIDDKGNVIDATFPKPDLPPTCTARLKQKLLTMQGWTAGEYNGMLVCSKYKWRVSCIRWQ